MFRQVGFYALVKTGKAFKKVFETPLFPACGMVDNNGDIHNSYKIIIDQMSCDTPMFYKCPYNGSYEFLNFSVRGDGGFGIYPSGTYNIGILYGTTRAKVDLARMSTVIGFKLKKN